MKYFTRLKYSDSFWALLFLSPNLILFLMFTLVPVLASFGFSFTEWDLLRDPTWIGLGNFKEMFSDRIFRQVMGNTLYYSLVSVPLGVAFSLLLAILVNQKLRGVKFYRAIYFLPVISSTVAVAIVWQWIYNPEFGLLNYFLEFVGIKGPNWLGSTKWAMPAVIIASTEST